MNSFLIFILILFCVWVIIRFLPKKDLPPVNVSEPVLSFVEHFKENRKDFVFSKRPFSDLVFRHYMDGKATFEEGLKSCNLSECKEILETYPLGRYFNSGASILVDKSNSQVFIFEVKFDTIEPMSKDIRFLTKEEKEYLHKELYLPYKLLKEEKERNLREKEWQEEEEYRRLMNQHQREQLTYIYKKDKKDD